jgi:hypothetical protein
MAVLGCSSTVAVLSLDCNDLFSDIRKWGRLSPLLEDDFTRLGRLFLATNQQPEAN